MAKKSLTIQNRNGDELYPVTVSSLVYDNSTGNTVKQDLDSLIGQVAELLGVENAFFGGIVGASTDIATDYSNKGYSGPYLYMVGTDMSSLVAYQYSGSGSPTQLFSGTTYDFTDYTDVKQLVATLSLKTEGISKRFNTSVARLLAAVLRKVAYIDTSIQDSANELIAILDAQASVLSISATYIGGQKYTGDTISVNDFAVNAIYDDNTSGSVTATSVSPVRLTSTSTQVTVSYSGKTSTVTVPATFNAVVDISDISTTQTNAAEGQSVDLSAITYTLHYANGNVVEMNDPNIITATPSVLSAGTNNITIALADDPTVDGILTINASGAVTSAYVEKTFTNAANTSSGLLTFSSPMTVTPTRIVITNPTTVGSAAARLRGATLTYNSQTSTWGGTAHNGSTPDTNPRTLTAVNVTLSGNEGNWTGVTISNLQCVISGSTYTLQFRGTYTFTISSETT